MSSESLTAALAYVHDHARAPIDTFVILGSGLGDVADALVHHPIALPYREIPGMPSTFIGGHRGELLIDTTQRRAVSLGRAHLYQGIAARDVVFPIRLAAKLGAKRVVLTNAAGSLLDTITPGSLVLISDHLNLTGCTPLEFANPITPTPDFVSMVDAYTPALRSIARRIAERQKLTLHEGIYAGVYGPAYETPAEAHMLRLLGASVVGMSTVLETIAARALGLDVLGISLATNASGTHGDHLEVLAAAKRGSRAIAELLAGILAEIQDN